MTNRNIGITLYIMAAIIMFSAVLFGNSLQEYLRSYPLENYLAENGLKGRLRFFSFAFGFPLGIGLALIGAIVISEANKKRIILFAIVTVLASLAAGIIPAIFGRSLSAVYFGGGGYSIMVLSLGAIWFWGQYRKNIESSMHLALDLQGLGYLCFAIAIWNLCGGATMPSFSLEPKMMLLMNSQAFAIGQMKSIMALFIAGWIFTLLGFRQASRQTNKQ